MRKIFVPLIAALFPPSSLVAADLPVKAPQSAYVSDAFSGPYLGINAGYGFNLGAFGIGPASIQDLAGSSQGFLGGIQAGYGQRVGQFLYLGVEGDLDGAAITGTAGMPGLITGISKNSWLTSVRARAGIILFNDLLAYGTVGWGWGGGEFSVSEVSTQLFKIDPTMSGFVWGGGFEHPFGGGFNIGLEYLQYDFGSFNNTMNVGTTESPTLLSFTQKDRVDAIRIRLNYKF